MVKKLNLLLQLHDFVIDFPLVGFKSALLSPPDFLSGSKNLLNGFLLEHHLIELAESWLLLLFQLPLVVPLVLAAIVDFALGAIHQLWLLHHGLH